MGVEQQVVGMSRRRFGSVRSANNHLYEDTNSEGSPAPLLRKTQLDYSESPSRARELHMARRDISRYKETRTDTDSFKARAQSELYDANSRVRHLSSAIQESNSAAKAHMREMEALRKPNRRRAAMAVDDDDQQYHQVVKELQLLRQELSMLKVDMASVLEEKLQAEKQAEEANEKMMFYTSSVDAIRNEIEEAGEEQVLVELAQIEALREFGDIQSQREQEANQLKETREKIKDVSQQLHHSKQVETKLSVTLADVDVLQNDLKQVKEMEKGKEMEKRFQSPTDSFQFSEASFGKGEDSEAASPLLQSITEELEATKKELATVKEEGFQYMASMDVIRNEMKHITDEINRIKKTEDKADATVQHLNSKLLRAKAKLEAVSASEEKVKAIQSSLSATLEQLKTDADVAKKEKERASEDASTIKSEILKTESDIDLAEEKFEAAMQELEAVKSSEAVALQNLKSLIENTMRERASAAQSSSSITISKFEYEYLTGRAAVAEELADKKVAAAQAWIEAIKASEKEILIKVDIAQRELNETNLGEEEPERQVSGVRMVEGQDFQMWRQRDKNAASGNRRAYGNLTPVRRANGNLTPSRRANGNLTPSRRAKFRKSASPGARNVNVFPIQKRKKAMPNLGKFFGGKKDIKDAC